MKDVVRSVAPLLKRAGFRKRRHTFNRTLEPGLVHVLNFQMGEFNPPGPRSVANGATLESLDMPGYLYGRFTINLGVYVAGMVIEGDKARNWVNHYNCQLRKRIGQLLTGEDAWWSLESPAEIASVVETALSLAGLPWLDRFSHTSSIVDAFKSEGWAALGLPPVGPLQIAWLLKDTEPEDAEVLIRSYLSQDLYAGHREGVERQLRAAGFGHLLDPT
jgi:hypothetical protein